MNWWNAAVGSTAEIERTFTAKDIQLYAALTGDTPVSREVPEPLIAGLFSKLLGVDLPGPGTNYLKQEMEFVGRAHVDEPLHAVVQVTRVRVAKRLVDLSTTCHSAGQRLICRGRALVLARGR